MLIFAVILGGITYDAVQNKVEELNHDSHLDFSLLNETVTPLTETSGMQMLGNRIENPHLRYESGDTRIPSWRIRATNDVFSGIGNEITIGTTRTSTGYRNLAGYTQYRFIDSNPSGVFQAKSVGAANANAAFYLVSQTATLVTGKQYYFRAELSSSGGTSRGLLNIYAGNDVVSGSNPIANTGFEVNDTVEIIEVPFTANTQSVTLSMRHFRNTNANISLSIHQLGFYLEDDYLLQKELQDLFQTLVLENLKFDSLTSINEKIVSIQNKLTTNASLYTADVRTYVENGLATAIPQSNQLAQVYNKINDAYTDSTQTEIKTTINEMYLSELSDMISNTTNQAFKNDFMEKYDEILRIYDIQQQKPGKLDQLRREAEADQAVVDGLEHLTQAQKDTYKNQID